MRDDADDFTHDLQNDDDIGTYQDYKVEKKDEMASDAKRMTSMKVEVRDSHTQTDHSKRSESQDK